MILCNVRVLRAPLSGVQRYTLEVLKRLPFPVQTIGPPDAVGGSLGHIWEQAALPVHARGRLLWSPASTGPVGVANQIVTIHDIAPLDCPEGYSPGFRRWYGFIWQYLLPHARALIAVSEFTKRRVVEKFGLKPGSIHVTPLGLDHGRFFPQPPARVQALRRKLALPEKFAVFVGALSARKNLVRLIEAWRQCEPAGFHLVIAGGGEAKRALAGSSLPALPDSIISLGRVDDDDLPALLTAAHLFVYPSLYEGFGLPPLEAMACGTPCLVSNVTALPEVTAGAALHVNPFEVSDIAHGLSVLLADTVLHERLRAEGLQHAARFTWESTAAKTADVLARYASKRPTTRAQWWYGKLGMNR
jgi:glycosyltransferase involved in cell wall biosynthesis